MRYGYYFIVIAFFSILIASTVLAVTRATTDPIIQIYPSIGSIHHFCVRGRVFKYNPDASIPHSTLGANLYRLFANKEWKHAPLKITVAGITRNAISDDEGLFEVDFDSSTPLAPKIYDARAEVPGRAQGIGAVRLVAPGQRIIVSDIDDTVVVTNVTNKLQLLRTALFQNEDTQKAIPGMAQIYQCLSEGNNIEPGAAIIYLSGSPIQFYSRIKGFLKKNNFPFDGIVLRHLKTITKNVGAYKLKLLNKLIHEFPDNQFTFFGDSGERDPEIYAQIKKLLGEDNGLTYIRIVTRAKTATNRFNQEVPFFSATDVARNLADKGLITPLCLERIEHAQAPNHQDE